MTRSELIEELARSEGITLKAAELAVNVAFESIAKTLAEDGRVEIQGIGSFKVKDYEEYQGRNPSTGEPISVAPKKLPVLRVGRELKTGWTGRSLLFRNLTTCYIFPASDPKYKLHIENQEDMGSQDPSERPQDRVPLAPLRIREPSHVLEMCRNCTITC